MWDGKEETWKSLPVPPVLTYCLSGGVQAWRLPTGAKGKLQPCLPTTFCCSAPDLCLCPRTVLAEGIPHTAPWQLEGVSGERTCLAKGLSAAHPRTTAVPAAWGELGLAGVTPLPGSHCHRDPSKGQCSWSHTSAWRCLLEEGETWPWCFPPHAAGTRDLSLSVPSRAPASSDPCIQ